MITLSSIREWKPDHLDALHDHFNELADRRGNTMDAIARSAYSLNWTGEGDQGMRTAVAVHAATAATDAQTLRATASVAKAGGQTGYGLQQQLLNTVARAQNAGFKVGDDFSVTDTAADPYMRAARRSVGAALQSALTGQAAAFTSQEAQTAAEITAGAAPLGTVQCHDNGGGGLTCVEHLPDGSLYTWPNAPGDLSGVWPDAAKTGSTRGAQMMDFRTGGGPGDIGEPPSPIGDEHYGASGGATPLEPTAGGPPMPQGWGEQPPPPPSAAPKCGPLELAGDTLDNATAMGGETAAALLLPTPLSPAAVIGLIGGARAVQKTSETLLNCLKRGVEW